MELLNKKLKEDPNFKEHLKSNPKETLKKLTGRDLPFDVVIHEDTKDTKNLVLSEKELSTISGGCWDWLHG